MKDYQYLPLDSQRPSFRLLRLRRGNTFKIKCDVFHALISDRDTVPYEALSYTWGSTDLVDYVEVDGKRLWITENLYSALLCLRRADRDRVLWIDAICMNQSDKAEQSQQVQEMGSIFRFAERVIIWLGKPTAEATLFMEFLSGLESQSLAPSPERVKVEGVDWVEPWPNAQQLLKSQDSNLLVRLRTGLQTLLKRSWFERVWILQEVANAQSATVSSGPLSVSAHVFALGPALLELNPNHHVQSVLDLMPGPTQVSSQKSRGRDQLINLLRKFSACKATDQRDMLYALLAMSTEPSNHGLLRPSYTKPLSEVLHNAVRYWLESNNVSVQQVIQCLADFKAVNTVCLIVQQETKIVKEKIQAPSMSETFEVMRNASFFLLEEDLGESSRDQNTCHAELDRLQQTWNLMEADLHLKESLRIVPWQSSHGNVKLLILKYTYRALEYVSIQSCWRTFDLIMNSCIDKNKDLLDRLLYKASSDGYSSVVQKLLEDGADINARGGGDNDTALYRASIDGFEEVVQVLLNAGANVHAKGGKFDSALHAASYHGEEQVVRMLLSAGADVNAEAGYYGTALQTASAHLFPDRNEKTVQILLDAGADVNINGGEYGTALQIALDNRSWRIVQKLLDAGADVNIEGGKFGTALQAASYRGSKEIVQMLLNAGANVNIIGGVYGTTLQAILRSQHTFWCEQIVQILLDAGADVNTEEGSCGTALQTASRIGSKDVVRMLLNAGADVDAQGEKHGTALQVASGGGHEEVAQMLLDAGADINAKGGKHGTALQAASRCGRKQMVHFLLARGAYYSEEQLSSDSHSSD